ncbi:hypothetical protein [Rhodoferax antarcticus]|uniref:hypothetical protein n=1 Tax=Rhodoferax antarcticus TaxID=81479 RepID=UPI0011150F29|nr:hypothetical protein [Rhodoferax antarcticus]
MNIRTFVLLFIFAGCAFRASAEETMISKPAGREMTSGEAFKEAIRTGMAQGVLVGPEADRLKRETRSNELTLIQVEKGEVKDGGCQVLVMTLTQPNVPTRTGANAGNYVSKTRLTLCKDGSQPLVEVIGCSVGMANCMPQ